MENKVATDLEVLKTHQQERDYVEAVLNGKKGLNPMSFIRGVKFKISLFFCGKSRMRRKKLYSSLFDDVRDYCEIPVSSNTIDDSNYDNCSKCLREIIVLKEEISKETNRNEQNMLYRNMADRKMELFYEVSIKGEAICYPQGYGLYRFFVKQLRSAKDKGDSNLLRVESEFFDRYKKKIKTVSIDDLQSLMLEYRSILNMDVKNLFGNVSVNKLSKQTDQLRDIHERLQTAYKSLKTKRYEIDDIWGFLRLCAYRNIFLGVEMINCFYFKAGGKSLTTNKEELQLPDNDIPNVEFKKVPDWGIKEIWNSMDIGNIFSKSLDSIDGFVNIVSSNEEGLKFARENKELALGMAGAFVLTDMIVEISEQIAKARNEKIKELGKLQIALIRKIEKIVRAFTSFEGPYLRAVEVIKAIVKANEGFMKIYSPLRERVFENGDFSSITIKDIQQITIATNEYNKIATSKL